ncbi:hypothetical protein RF11_03263 [Thelohanellus kitauei]|uniref:Profilin n=1 Tax=Thelohanellus kitauei TaxID=669202 RepID=A0A0C2J9H0_THEKT|nr:hypothetical protein RF11_03263 [Thelohanellus kitauei]
MSRINSIDNEELEKFFNERHYEQEHLKKVFEQIAAGQSVETFKINEKNFVFSDMKDKALACYEGKNYGVCICKGNKYVVMVSSHDYHKGKDVVIYSKELVKFLEHGS